MPAMGCQKMLMFSEEYLERRSMDQCVKRDQLDTDMLKEQLLNFRDKIREFRAVVHEMEAAYTEGGFQHLDDGVGLGYIEVDQSEKVADDKQLQNALLPKLVDTVSKVSLTLFIDL